MSNAKSMTTGGANSAIGPVQMRKAAQLRGGTKNMISTDQSNFKDSQFSSVKGKLNKLSFALDSKRVSPEFSSQIQTV